MEQVAAIDSASETAGWPPALLATKMHAPGLRADAVARTRIVQRLSDAPVLTVVTAPPGFGKTTMIAEWLAERAQAVAWVSLDERDDVPLTFWRYVLTALAATADLSSPMAALLRQDATIEDVLTGVVNALDDSGMPVVLVLDDFHVIEERRILSGVGFLIHHAPSNLRIVLAARAEPALPLARLRAAGDLAELGVAELRFDDAEVAEYFERTAGVTVTRDEARMLGKRTEGWVAALQLAAISLRGRADASAFVGSFAGDDRHVVDYLVEEVLRHQSDEGRRVLLDASVLSRFTADLMAEVTGTADGGRLLSELDRANMFLVPLDDQRRWYRFHHLFAQMLRARLQAEHPDRVGLLHERASAWFDEAGFVEDAIDHAVEGHAFDRAVSLILGEAPARRRGRDEATLVHWIERLPIELVRSDAMLSLELAGALLAIGRLGEVDALLAHPAVVASTHETHRLDAGVALYRSAQALAVGSVGLAESFAALAIASTTDDDHLVRGSASGLRGLAKWNRGDLAGANAEWVAAVDDLRRAEYHADARGGAIALIDIAIAQGRLSDAATLADGGARIVRGDDQAGKGRADMLVALAAVLIARDDLVRAEHLLDQADALGPGNGLPQNAHRLLATRARLHLARGDSASALRLLDDAEAVFTPDFFPDHHPIAAQRASALLASGRSQEARAWARARGLTADDEADYLVEYEHLVFARILLSDAGATSRDSAERAAGLLERMLSAAVAGGRLGSAIEIRVVLALALARAGRRRESHAALLAAVDAAESEGQVRVFADEGESLARLLTILAHEQPSRAFLARLRDAATTASSRGGAGARPMSPLSDREVEVLRLLGSDLSGAEIATHLSISLHTLRSHTKSIYAKLGVNSRRTAVTRAGELGLSA